MSKYRIVEEVFSNGEVKWFIQEKIFLWLWLPAESDRFDNPRYYDEKSDAIRQYESFQITSTKKVIHP